MLRRLGPLARSFHASRSPMAASSAPDDLHPCPDKALPAPTDDTAAAPTTTLDLGAGSTTVRLDALGPMVVGRDGTVARIANWGGMTEAERTNTLRIIGRRNQQRLAALRAKDEQS